MRAVRRLLVALAGLALLPGVASAHGVTTEEVRAPIPLDLLLAGAAWTVGITAVWLFAHGSVPRGPGRREIGSVAPRAASAVRIVARGTFLVVFVGVLVAGLLGRQVQAENPATLFVWPVWFKGIAVLAIVAGSPWRVLAPWRTIYDWLAWLEGTEFALLGDYPERLGAWPAFLGFVVVIGVVENLTVVPNSPRKTAILVAAGSLLLILGSLCFGPAWFRHADPFDVLYRLLGRVAPIAIDRGDDGGYEVALRAPWRGCVAPVADASVAAFAVAMVYTVSFDGFTNTRQYRTLRFDLRDLLGTGPGTSVLVYVGGLVGFLVAYLVACWLIARLAGRGFERAGEGRAHGSLVRTAVRFAPTLVPIAAAYEVAHNYPYVVRNFDRLVVELLRPVAAGLEPVEPLSALPLEAFWGTQVVLIVLGHLVAVVAAHAVAIDRFGSAAAARRGHLPLVVVMVGYTVLSLWIVSRPVVAG